MIIHISQERYDLILSQGYGRFDTPPVMVATRFKGADDNEYHLLDGDRAHCEYCGAEFDSVPVNTFVELENYKLKVA